MLTAKQKLMIRERFQELRLKLIKLQGARDDFEKETLGKTRDWKKIAKVFENPELDKTNRIKSLQYPDCFVCEVMNKDCFIWRPNGGRECPELLFLGFCYADPANDFNDSKKCGLYKRATMHKRCLARLALYISKNGVDAKGVEDVTRYCQHCCSGYAKCVKKKTIYEQYLHCEDILERALKETIDYVDEIIGQCSK